MVELAHDLALYSMEYVHSLPGLLESSWLRRFAVTAAP
jgi:hypothetical protein